MNNYEKILQSFDLQDELNPEIWIKSNDTDQEKMKPEIRKKLIEIAYEFSDYLTDDLVVSDVIMTGSLANYNWNEFSDIDLHLIIDYKQFTEDQSEIYKKLFSYKKNYFNLVHDIKIYGYDVELYAQDKKESHFSTGVYSILKNKWDEYPKKESFKIDRDILISKVKSWTNKIDEIIESSKEDDIDESIKTIEKLKDKLKVYRTSGLEKNGEYSYENLVFKFLRRNGYIEKLFDMQNDLQDKNLSLTERSKR